MPPKVVFFQNLDILYRKSYSKFDGFWWLSVNLVVFLQTHRSVKCPSSMIDCETNFLSILENFFQSDSIFGGKNISAVYLLPRGRGRPAWKNQFLFCRNVRIYKLSRKRVEKSSEMSRNLEITVVSPGAAGAKKFGYFGCWGDLWDPRGGGGVLSEIWKWGPHNHENLK